MDSFVSSQPSPEGEPNSPTPTSSSLWPPLIHDRPVIPDHELLKLVGRGSYGEVWLARNIMGSFRAIKVIYRDAFENTRPYEREFEGIKKFEPISRTHPSQVDVLHVGRAEGCFYYVMELADDASSPTPNDSGQINIDNYSPRTLKSEINRRGPLPVEECIGIGLALTTALSHLHKSGLVHRDIKPSNIIYVNGLPKLADIGLVSELDATQSFVGTLGFAAPEWPGTPQADIYSLGKVLYEAGTGKDRQEFPELPTRFSGTEEQQNALIELNEVLLKACEGDPRDRYQTADEMHEDFLLLRAGKSLVRFRTVERRFAKLKKVSIVIGVIGFLAVAGVVLVSRQSRIVAKLGQELSKAEKESRRRLMQLQTAKGSDLLEQMDFGNALAWYSAALENVADNSRANEIHRIRINYILENFPKLTHFFVHSGPIFRCEFVSGGSKIMAHCAPDVLKVYDLTTGKLESSISGTNAAYPPAVYSPALFFSQNGSRVIVRGLTPDVSTEIFDLNSRRLVACAAPEPGELRRILDSIDGQVALVQTSSTTAQVLDIDTGRKLSPELKVSGQILTGRLSEHQGALALYFRTSSAQNRLQMWNLATGEPIGPPLFAGHHEGNEDSTCSFLIFKEGREAIVTTADSNNVLHSQRFNVETGEAMANDLLAFHGIESLVIRPNAQWVTFRLAGHRNKLVNFETGETLEFTHADYFRDIAFSTDELLVATVGTDSQLCIWQKNVGSNFSPTVRHYGSQGVTFSPDTGQVATCGVDGSLRVWGLAAASQPRLTLRLPKKGIDAGFSSKGNIVTLTDGSASTRIWSAIDGRPLTRPLTEGPAMNGIVFSPDGNYVVTATKTIEQLSPCQGAFLWRLSDSQRRCSWLHKEAFIYRARFSPDSKEIVTTGTDMKACIWDASSGGLLRTLDHDSHVTDAVYNPSGSMLATATSRGPVRVWNRSTGALIREFRAPNVPCYTLAFAVGDRYLAGGASDGKAYVWDLTSETNAPKQFWQGGSPVKLKSIVGGTLLVTHSPGSATKVWDVAKGALYPPVFPGQTLSVEVSRDEGFFLSRVLNQSLRLWDVKTGELVWGYPGLLCDSARFNPLADEFACTGFGDAVRVWKWKPCGYSLEDVSDFSRLLFSGVLESTGSTFPLKTKDLEPLYLRLRKAHPEAFTITTQERTAWHEKMAWWAGKNHLWESEVRHLTVAIENNTSLSQDPTGDEVFLRRGEANAELGNFIAADGDLDRAVHLDPEKLSTWHSLMISALAQGKSAEFAEIFGKALAHFSWITNRSDADCDGWKIELAEMSGVMPKLLSAYDSVLKQVDDCISHGGGGPETIGVRGKALYRAGRFHQAIPELEKAAIEAEKNSPANWFTLAMSYQMAGRHEEATKSYERGCETIKALSKRAEGPPEWQHRVIDNSLKREAEVVLQIYEGSNGERRKLNGGP